MSGKTLISMIGPKGEKVCLISCSESQKDHHQHHICYLCTVSKAHLGCLQQLINWDQHVESQDHQGSFFPSHHCLRHNFKNKTPSPLFIICRYSY